MRAVTFLGSFPEPSNQDHKFRGHLLPEEVVSTPNLPGFSPRKSAVYLAKALILFEPREGWGGIALVESLRGSRVSRWVIMMCPLPVDTFF